MFKEVYTSTSEHERALRDVAALVVRMERDTYKCGKPSVDGRKMALDMMRDIPELSVDVATTVLQKDGLRWICQSCQARLLFPCRCNKMIERCKEAACIELYGERSQCRRCGQVGTLRPGKRY